MGFSYRLLLFSPKWKHLYISSPLRTLVFAMTKNLAEIKQYARDNVSFFPRTIKQRILNTVYLGIVRYL